MRRVLLALAFLCVAPAAAAAQDDPYAEDPVEQVTDPAAEELGEGHDEASPHADHHGIDWWSVGAAAINFLILLYILVRMGRKPLASFLSERRQNIEQEIAEASRLKKEAQDKHAEYEARLKALDQEIAALRQEMIDAGVAERDRIIADAQSKAERMRKDTQFLIDQQLKQLRIDLTREAVTAAVAAAGDELKKDTTPQDQERLAHDYLARVAKGGQA